MRILTVDGDAIIEALEQSGAATPLVPRSLEALGVWARSDSIDAGYARGYTAIPELVERAAGAPLTVSLEGLGVGDGLLVLLSVRAAQVVGASAITSIFTVEYFDDATATTFPGLALEPSRDVALAADRGLHVASRHMFVQVGALGDNPRLHVGVDPGADGVLLSGGSVCLTAVAFPSGVGAVVFPVPS